MKINGKEKRKDNRKQKKYQKGITGKMENKTENNMAETIYIIFKQKLKLITCS